MTRLSEDSIEELQKKFPAALNYLVSIFLIQREHGKTGNASLARNLGVSKPAVNQAIGRLKKHNLVEQAPYESIRLTETGRQFAVCTLKKHYLIEHLLISRTNYPWEKSDQEAQRLQTCLSQDFTDYLYDFFGHPETCPHGNPFPDSPLEKALLSAPRLSDAPHKTPVKIIRITEEGEAVDGLLRFCHIHSIQPGKTLSIRERLNNDFLKIDCSDTELRMPLSIARYLCYKDIV